MLKRTYEWYRIVNANPSEDTVRARKLAVETLVKKIDESEDYSLLIGCSAGVVSGFEGGFKNQDTSSKILSSIQEHQQAFPSDFKDNALELRVCASIAIGEVITRNIEDDEGPDVDAILASIMLISGLGLRPEPQEQYMRVMMNELKEAAHKASQRAATKKREKGELDLSSLKAAAPTELPAMWKTFGQIMQSAISQLENQARNDREELNVMWWLYGNYSEVARKPISSLKPYEAAFCAGKEVGDLTQVPSYESVREMVIKAAQGNRKTESLRVTSLDSIVKQWNESEMRSLIPEENAVQDFVNSNPGLVPLTWLVSRIIDSGVRNGWTDEFQKKTGLAGSNEFSPTTIARQVFDERIAQRIYRELV